MKLIDSGILIVPSYPYKNHGRYDLDNGNSYLSKSDRVSQNFIAGTSVNIYQHEEGLFAALGDVPLIEVIRLRFEI